MPSLSDADRAKLRKSADASIAAMRKFDKDPANKAFIKKIKKKKKRDEELKGIIKKVKIDKVKSIVQSERKKNPDLSFEKSGKDDLLKAIKTEVARRKRRRP